MPVASYKPFESFFFFFFVSVSEKQHKTKAAVQHYLWCVNYTALSEGGCRNMRLLKGSICGYLWVRFHGQSG